MSGSVLYLLLAAAAPEAPSPWDTLSIFAGIEGAKQPQDFGVNAHLGGRIHADAGFPLLESAGLGIQFGVGLNLTENAVQVFERISESDDRFQLFFTPALFQRFENGLSWGLGVDYVYEDYFDDYSLFQARGQIGFAVDEGNEFGVRLSLPLSSDRGTFSSSLGTFSVRLDPIAQGALFWRHFWESGADTVVWAGLTEGTGQPNLALGDRGDTGPRAVIGFEMYAPLNDYFAIFGQSNFILPVDTGTVDAYLGLSIHPWGGAAGSRRHPFAPLLTTANNTTFSVDFDR